MNDRLPYRKEQVRRIKEIVHGTADGRRPDLRVPAAHASPAHPLFFFCGSLVQLCSHPPQRRSSLPQGPALSWYMGAIDSQPPSRRCTGRRSTAEGRKEKPAAGGLRRWWSWGRTRRRAGCRSLTFLLIPYVYDKAFSSGYIREKQNRAEKQNIAKPSSMAMSCCNGRPWPGMAQGLIDWP
jgi:hypothetical protein